MGRATRLPTGISSYAPPASYTPPTSSYSPPSGPVIQRRPPMATWLRAADFLSVGRRVQLPGDRINRSSYRPRQAAAAIRRRPPATPHRPLRADRATRPRQAAAAIRRRPPATAHRPLRAVRATRPRQAAAAIRRRPPATAHRPLRAGRAIRPRQAEAAIRPPIGPAAPATTCRNAPGASPARLLPRRQPIPASTRPPTRRPPAARERRRRLKSPLQFLRHKNRDYRSAVFAIDPKS